MPRFLELVPRGRLKRWISGCTRVKSTSSWVWRAGNTLRCPACDQAETRGKYLPAALYILESSVAVVPGALKRGLGRAGEPARLNLERLFPRHVL